MPIYPAAYLFLMTRERSKSVLFRIFPLTGTIPMPGVHRADEKGLRVHPWQRG